MSKCCSKCKETREIEEFPEGPRNQCRACVNLYAREWKKKNPQRQKETRAREYKKHRFTIALRTCVFNAKAKGYEPCNATKKEIEKAFTGSCQICGVPESECKRRLNMDHCHKTGEFRGWLCDSCNRALGHLRDSERIVGSMLSYLIFNRSDI